MANELVIGLVIGATLKGVQSAFSKVGKLTQDLGNKIDTAKTKQESLAKALSRNYPVKSLSALSQQYNQLSTAIQKAEASQRRLNAVSNAQQSLRNQRRDLQGKIAETTAHGYALGRPLIGSVKTFMEQEDAANDLKITMMKADGSIGKFEEIGKIADDLGRDLPGTRKDFYNLARALKMQGVTDDVLVGGGLQTSAKLNVLLDMDQFEGGEF